MPDSNQNSEKKIFPLVDFSVKKRVTISMLILIVVVFGLVSLFKLPLDMMPDLTFPMVTVVAQYRGVAPEEIERLVTVPLEGMIASVNRVKKVSSRSIEGASVITVEFEWGTNLDAGAQDIKDYIGQIKDFLPEGVKDPVIYKFSMSQIPVLFTGVSGIEDAYKLKKLLEDNVRERLQRMEGVAQCMVYGGKQREISVACDPLRLKGKGLNIDAVYKALAAQNMNSPAGYFTKSHVDYLVRAMGEFKSLDDIRNSIIGVAPDNVTPVRLFEVAEVYDTYKEKRNVMSMNGEESVFLMMYKQSGANTLNVSRKLNKELDEIKKFYPQLKFFTIFDQGRPVERVTSSTSREVVFGGVLAVFLLLIFLGNLRPTLIIAVAIPLSVITTFIVLYTTGFTLNLMTLGGLALGIGRLVDDAVVVIESIHRHLERGEGPVEASRRGASEVSLAISASTFTTIAVFLPLLFSSGLASQLMRGLALTIAFALLASLFVAFTIVPMLSSVFFKKPKKDRGQWFNGVRNWYGRWLAAVLNHPGKTVIGVLIILALSVGVGGVFIGKEYMPATDNGMMILNVELPVGTPLEETADLCAQLGKMMREFPEVQYVSENVGVDESNQGDPSSASITGPNGAQLFVRLVDPDKRTRTQQEIQDLIRARLPILKNAKITVAAMSMTMSGGKPVKINIYGNNFNTLREISDNIVGAIGPIPGLKDIESSFSKARPEYHFVVDRQKAMLYGLAPFQIQQAIQAANLGMVASQFRTGDEEIDIRVILDKRFRKSIEYLQQLPIKTPAGASVSLSQVTTLIPTEGPVVINRDNKFRTGVVDANISGRPLGSVVKDIKARIGPIEKALPSGYSISFGGEFKDMQETFMQLIYALLIAILLTYMIMAAQFESLLHPFVIFFTIPLSAIGVVWILLLFGKTLSVISFIGLIILAGIVLSNGIVMVDYINQLRRSGLALREGIIEGCKTRLRPVIITAGATIMGMVPMAFDKSESSAMTSPMAFTVIGGLLSATFLTLFVIPVVYQYFDRFGQGVLRRVKRVIR
jgi:hydrophobic/amphiphilic exporter-1 (mainly G- bacteria), HAE1 family